MTADPCAGCSAAAPLNHALWIMLTLVIKHSFMVHFLFCLIDLKFNVMFVLPLSCAVTL